jgi:lactate dehydrogenase-like 2-hydroxyacid dehydrogenase
VTASRDVLIHSVGDPLPAVSAALGAVFRVTRDSDPAARGIAVSGGHARVDAAFAAGFPALEIVANSGVGYDHIDAAAMAARGIVVTNTPDVLSEEVADLAMGLLLATVRRLPQADRHVRTGLWPKGAFPLTPTLRGRTVGILGLGRIGKAIARRLDGFGVAIEYHGREEQVGVPYRYHATVHDLAKSCDVLMITVPGGSSTKQLIRYETLEALGPNGILINVARGSVVDEAALIRALQDRTILAAGLDAFEDEPRVPGALIAMDQVVLLPHVGSGSEHTRLAMGRLMIDNLVSWFEGRGPLTPVPECVNITGPAQNGRR